MNGEMIEDAQAPAPDAVRHPQKKSLFNRPGWSKTAEQKGNENDELAFFSRAKELFPLRISEEERKRGKKEARAGRKRPTENVQQEKSAARADRKASGVKRRRTSTQENEVGENSEDDIEEASWTRRARKSSTPHDSEGSSHSPLKVQTSPKLLYKQFNHGMAKEGEVPKQAASNATITLNDSDGDDLYRASPVRKPRHYNFGYEDSHNPLANDAISVIDDEDNDVVVVDEYSDLIEKARQKRAELEAQKARERLRTDSSFGENSHGTRDTDDVFGENRLEVDPILSILVTSLLDGAKPLVLMRRVSQRLKEVKAAWTDRQDPGVISENMKPEIVLTWKGKHLFDVTTCAHLGIKVGLDGNLPPDGLDDFGRLHLEAWTNDSLSAYTIQQEQERLRTKEHEEPEQEREPEVEVERIKLILKAKDLAPVKMRVPTTYFIKKVEEYFRMKYPEIGDQEVLLYFEGEKLSPEMMLKDTDLGDMGEVDTVEVLIK